MKKLTILVLAMLSLQLAKAQEAVLSSGDFQKNNSGSISYSIGETVTETVSGNGTTLTQGMQQPILSVTTLTENIAFKIDISAFPNPASDYLILKSKDFKGLTVALYDVSGKVLINRNLEKEETQIDFRHYAASTYILKITQNNQEIKSFTIIKK
jgi:hypothetical protein